jgi:hypothetical protein
MFYIHDTSCISPQQTFSNIDIHALVASVDNKLKVIEPAEYEGIPKNILRRMGKGARIGVGAALPLISRWAKLAGIIIGTANGGMEDSVIFLKQIIEYDEGLLLPGNFVQSTSNAIAAQLSLLSKNKGYNITHVHRGLAFENAMIDAGMMLREHTDNSYLLGAVDEISTYNYKFEQLEGWYKQAQVSNKDLYQTNTSGSISGEAAVMFVVNNNAAGAIAKVTNVITFYTDVVNMMAPALQQFLGANHLSIKDIDLLISGENGDNRLDIFYEACEALLGGDVTVARFKHMSGEYATASAFALWLASCCISSQPLPDHMIKKTGNAASFKNVLIYNCYKGVQHSFILVTK